MDILRKAAQQALEALDGVLDTYGEPLDLMTISGGTYEALKCRDAITALRAALAQPEQEPVAYQWLGTSVIRKRVPKIAEVSAWVRLYAAPPQLDELFCDTHCTWHDHHPYCEFREVTDEP